MVQPSSRREGFTAIPNVKWADVGGLDYLREEFDRYIVRRIKFPEEYEVVIMYDSISTCLFLFCQRKHNALEVQKEVQKDLRHTVRMSPEKKGRNSKYVGMED